MKPIAEIRAMSEQERRVKTAEACGWTLFDSHRMSPHMWHLPGQGVVDTRDLPDYLYDLNVMHEAEKAVLTTEELRRHYKAYLIDLVFSVPELNRSIVFATAEQRNAALLATVL